ncbi:MAG: hypothetical protein BWX84_02338 [Verrucomicrobia bacterium ADurb.Bin118]|nr:MAG: hypothetical protein BWX84_02338 [Verrucomicrobia bacterium ADurb.Bin118]
MGAGQPFDDTPELRRRPFELALKALPQQGPRARHPFAAGEHVFGENLRRRGGGGGAHVGHKITDGKINLMPHGGHHRQRGRVNGAGHRLLVERP